MNLVPYDFKKIENATGYVMTKSQKIIDEFVDSGYDCVKVEGWTNKSACSYANSLNQTIARMHKGGIKAISRRGEVFLVKTSLLNK